jgi:hypothetical protein
MFVEILCTVFWKNGWIGVTNATLEGRKLVYRLAFLDIGGCWFANLDISHDWSVVRGRRNVAW